jgi:hypothetical protein
MTLKTVRLKKVFKKNYLERQQFFGLAALSVSVTAGHGSPVALVRRAGGRDAEDHGRQNAE